MKLVNNQLDLADYNKYVEIEYRNSLDKGGQNQVDIDIHNLNSFVNIERYH